MFCFILLQHVFLCSCGFVYNKYDNITIALQGSNDVLRFFFENLLEMIFEYSYKFLSPQLMMNLLQLKIGFY